MKKLTAEEIDQHQPIDYGDGVFVESRYRHVDEINRVKMAVSLMPIQARRQLKSVYCDSKEGGYILETDSWSVAHYFSEAMLQVSDTYGVIAYGLDRYSAQPL